MVNGKVGNITFVCDWDGNVIKSKRNENGDKTVSSYMELERKSPELSSLFLLCV